MAELITDRLVSSILSSYTPSSSSPSVKDSKEKLSFQTTTANFTRFVKKSGPLFWLQDQLESVVWWEDCYKSVFWGSAWAFFAFYPTLLVLAPNALILYIILNAYVRQHPTPDGQEYQQPTTADSSLPSEGSVDYLENMQNIQITMGRLSYLTDLYRQVIKYLDWSDPRATLAIFNMTMLLSTATFFALPFLPIRLLIALSFPLTLVFTSPAVTKSHVFCPLANVLREYLSSSSSSPTTPTPTTATTTTNTTPQQQRTQKAKNQLENECYNTSRVRNWLRRLCILVNQFIAADSLSDEMLDAIDSKLVSQVIVYETERRRGGNNKSNNKQNDIESSATKKDPTIVNTTPSKRSTSTNFVFQSNNSLGSLGWSTDALLPKDPPAWLVIGKENLGSQATKGLGDPPQGMQWVPGEEWKIDLLADWFEGLEPHHSSAKLDEYLDNDGWLYLDDYCADLPESPSRAQMRRRKWSRRAIPS